MPIYVYACPDHGPFEEYHPMAESSRPRPCLVCGRRSSRQLMVPRVLSQPDWSQENGGRGRQIDQMHDTFARSPKDVPEIAKRAGWVPTKIETPYGH